MGTEFRLTVTGVFDTEAGRDAAYTELKADNVIGVKDSGAKRIEVIKDSYSMSEPVVTGREFLPIIS